MTGGAITYAEHAADILDAAATCLARGQRFALVTSMEIRGGAARHLGALALVDETGAMQGYLSNGCIDGDIRYRAMQALKTGAPDLVRYGEGSPFMDLRLPCGGALTVLIDPAPDHAGLMSARAALNARQPATLGFTAPGLERRFSYAPRFRLVLAGRGAIFRAMAHTGQATGFALHLMSPDDADLAAAAALPDVTTQALTTPDAAPDLTALDCHAAFVTLFHDHDWEPSLLQAALARPARFIGCLGSTRSHAQRLAVLRGMGVTEIDLDRLTGPIGLVPSLRDAPLIAVSALAQIVAAMPPAITQIERPDRQAKAA